MIKKNWWFLKFGFDLKLLIEKWKFCKYFKKLNSTTLKKS